MPAALLSRAHAVEKIQLVFRDWGYEGASLAAIAEATGLGKSSLYHYFPGGKDEMVVAVLDRIATWMRDEALAPLSATGTPRARFRAVLKSLDGFYDGGRNACVLGNLVTGSSRIAFQQQLQAAFRSWIDALCELAREAGLPRAEALRRAEDVVVRIEGALIVAGGTGDTGPFKRALENVERDFLT